MSQNDTPQSSTNQNLSKLQLYEEALLRGLNPRQLEAVQAVTGSNLVIAGAGSGKTAVLTRRVAYLISRGQTPGEILCLTFTNKAAKEMNTRVRGLLSSIQIDLPYVAPWNEDYLSNPLLVTFHSLGVRILREFGEKVGLRPEFSILDTEDQKKIIRGIFKDLDVDKKKIQPSLVSYFISQCKQELLVANDSRKVSKDFLPIFHQVYKKYEEILYASSVVDFEDLLLKPYLLMRDNPDVLEVLRSRWKHVMVDEFQDTNEAQFELIKLLVSPQMLVDLNRSLFVVGDDAQSIYGFRGSKIEIILNFEQQYPGTLEVMLNQNYRSTQKILDLAEKVLSHNPKQKRKDLFTDKPETLDVHYFMARNDKVEAEFIIKTMAKLYGPSTKAELLKEKNLENDGLVLDTDNDQEVPTVILTPNDPVSAMFDVYLETEDFSPTSSLQQFKPTSWSIPTIDWGKIPQLDECAVLYRTHSQSRAIEEAFLQNRVPYKLVSGTRFLDRKEIKDVLAILKFLSNGNDRISLSRFLPLVLPGVGPKTLEKMLAYLNDYEYPLPPKNQEQLLGLIGGMQSVWQYHTKLIDMTKELLVITNYARYLKGEYPVKEEFEARMENIGELYSLMFPFDQDTNLPLDERLTQFLAQIMLMSSLEIDEEQDIPKISLMSLHQSKGLEFETVFLVGIEDGLLPHINSLIEPGGVEEEVRLAYVGVTRAKKHLYLTSADSRVQFGQIKANPVSRIFRPFLDTYIKRTV
jgi:DNA helicase II / ATP-dependent DNA helicase PcrA